MMLFDFSFDGRLQRRLRLQIYMLYFKSIHCSCTVMTIVVLRTVQCFDYVDRLVLSVSAM